MIPCTPDAIKSFLLRLYADQLSSQSLPPSAIPDSSDLLVEGIIDSLGVLEMISQIETEFNVTFDLEGLAVEDLTVLGPLCEYIARTAKPKTLPA